MKVLRKRGKFVPIISFVKETNFYRFSFHYLIGEFNRVKCVSSRLMLPIKMDYNN